MAVADHGAEARPPRPPAGGMSSSMRAWVQHWGGDDGGGLGADGWTGGRAGAAPPTSAGPPAARTAHYPLSRASVKRRRAFQSRPPPRRSSVFTRRAAAKLFCRGFGHMHPEILACLMLIQSALVPLTHSIFGKASLSRFENSSHCTPVLSGLRNSNRVFKVRVI